MTEGKRSPYYEAVLRQLDAVRETQAESLERAARATFRQSAVRRRAPCLRERPFPLSGRGGVSQGGRPRPGERDPGSVPDAAHAPRLSGQLERVPGLAALIVERHDLRGGEVLPVISNSGINGVPVEMARREASRSHGNRAHVACAFPIGPDTPFRRQAPVRGGGHRGRHLRRGRRCGRRVPWPGREGGTHLASGGKLHRQLLGVPGGRAVSGGRSHASGVSERQSSRGRRAQPGAGREVPGAYPRLVKR